MTGMADDKKLDCWICGQPGAEPERTLLGFKKPICPPGKGCSRPRIKR